MKQARKPLLDALLACRSMARAMTGVSFDDFLRSEEKRAAVERWLILIGEALNQAAAIDPAVSDQIPDLRRIVAMRHRLVHGYSETDPAIIWETVQFNIAPLRAILEGMLPDEALS